MFSVSYINLWHRTFWEILRGYLDLVKESLPVGLTVTKERLKITHLSKLKSVLVVWLILMGIIISCYYGMYFMEKFVGWVKVGARCGE